MLVTIRHFYTATLAMMCTMLMITFRAVVFCLRRLIGCVLILICSFMQSASDEAPLLGTSAGASGVREEEDAQHV